MTSPQETSTNKYLFWGIQTLFAIIISLGTYVYTSNLKSQSEYNRTNDKKVLEMQKQVLELIRSEATTKQILIQIQDDVSENKQTMKERFDKLEDKIDKLK